ncbi:MAG: FkbM family methyltransferase, partial [Rhodospirillales bacterium]|nr:FkbM family methyltransferase [Rhodospirillales bacterium]
MASDICFLFTFNDRLLTCMMLLETIRRRFHPLHVLRRARVAKYFGILDIRLPVRVHGVDRRIYVRLLRHLSSIIDNRLIETELTALIRVLVARDRPAMFWDIGAHIGFYSWMFLTLSPSGHVVMFEPDPGNRDLIRRTLAGDMNPNVVVLPYAISDENGEAVFERDPISGATGGLTRDRATFVARNFGIAAPTMTVATHTLDRIMESPKFAAMPPALIKMDIEGAELQALRGG